MDLGILREILESLPKISSQISCRGRPWMAYCFCLVSNDLFSVPLALSNGCRGRKGSRESVAVHAPKHEKSSQRSSLGPRLQPTGSPRPCRGSRSSKWGRSGSPFRNEYITYVEKASNTVSTRLFSPLMTTSPPFPLSQDLLKTSLFHCAIH